MKGADVLINTKSRDQGIAERRKAATEEIEKICAGRLDQEFMKAKWKDMQFGGKPVLPLPSWLIDDYKMAIMWVRPVDMEHTNQFGQQQNILGAQLELIARTNPEDVVMGYIPIISDVFRKTVPAAYCKNFNSWVTKRIIVEELTFIYNELFEQKRLSITAGREFLLAAYDPKTWHKIEEAGMRRVK